MEDTSNSTIVKNRGTLEQRAARAGLLLMPAESRVFAGYALPHYQIRDHTDAPWPGVYACTEIIGVLAIVEMVQDRKLELFHGRLVLAGGAK